MQNDRTFENWNKDVNEFIKQKLDKKDVGPIYLGGYSAGGPYVLNCASDDTIQKKIKKAIIISSLAPP
eukprot:UN05041